MTETAHPDRTADPALARGTTAEKATGGVLPWIGWSAGALLALVLVYSSWGKALDPQGVGVMYVRKHLLPANLATAVVIAGVTVEAAVAFALLADLRRRIVLIVATLMMTAFFGLTLYEFFYPGKDAMSCGCFGNTVVRTPAQAVVQDGLFVVLALLAWIGRRPGPLLTPRWLAPLAGGAAALALAVAAPSLPVDDWATRLKPGAKAADLGVDEAIVPELFRGKTFVLLLDRADEATRKQMGRVNTGIALKGGPVAVLGLAEDNEELAMQFTWSAAPAFEVRSVPFSSLKPLYRTLPRAFLIDNGVVRHIWNTIPDDATLASIAEGKTS